MLLRPPFFPKYHEGYIRKCKDGRTRIDLYGGNKSRTTMSYARFLMCMHLQKILDAEFHVDHINDDPTDDRLENLQVLAASDNIKKSAVYGRATTQLKCASCSTVFTREIRQVHPGKTYCSIDCRLGK
jgi:hypothetical protein